MNCATRETKKKKSSLCSSCNSYEIPSFAASALILSNHWLGGRSFGLHYRGLLTFHLSQCIFPWLFHISRLILPSSCTISTSHLFPLPSFCTFFHISPLTSQCLFYAVFPPLTSRLSSDPVSSFFFPQFLFPLNQLD